MYFYSVFRQRFALIQDVRQGESSVVKARCCSIPLSVARASVLLLIGVQFTIVSAVAQISTASVNGTVRDSASAVVPGAAIVLRHTATGVETRTVTNEIGNYVLLSILPGTYTLETTKEGFNTSRLAPFVLTVNQTATFNFRIEVGAVQQALTVEAVGAQVQGSTAELGSLVTHRQVLDLPIRGRDFQQLMGLSPGVNTVSTGQSSIPSVNGQVNRSTLFYLDGMNDNAAMFNQYAVAPILDARV